MYFGKAEWRTYEKSIEKEWLLTNGLGGFASSTITGANSRRYHGLLIASLRPPVERHLILSKIDESIVLNGTVYDIASFQAGGYTAYGFHYLQRVRIDPIPTFFYQVSDFSLEKSVCMIYGENTTAIVYKVFTGSDKALIRLTPLVNFRDYHGNSTRIHMRFRTVPSDASVSVWPFDNGVEIKLSSSSGRFIPYEDCWFYGMFYAREAERGLNPFEDHYIPGRFEVEIPPREECCFTIVVTTEKEISTMNGMEIIENERDRLRKIIEKTGSNDEFIRKLAVAADSFIVRRQSTGTKTVIAGYPWFTDWGRDAMIALPGLTLATGRFEDAKEILLTFSKYVRHGLVPNMFPDFGQEPLYNSVDSALWYFEAVEKYIQYSKDYDFVRNNIYNTLTGIISAFEKGTLYNIHMDEDCLVTAGSPDLQLTWMDAKIGNHVVTPRHGKAVEINALWYNALKIMENLSARFDQDSLFYSRTASIVAENFLKCFWNEKGQYLYDVVNGEYKDDSIRPNQIMAVSLSYPVITGEKAKKVVQKVWKELYATYGLRSLSMGNPAFVGTYEGDQYKRDIAYHQGTVWVWPLGQFVTGFIKAYGNSCKNLETAKKLLLLLEDHLNDACIGQISEIFDGSGALTPRGCFAQAWSVAEVLRAYVELTGFNTKG